MTNVQDDIEYFEVTLQIPEGNADVRNVKIPTTVQAGTPFVIEYDVYNLGGDDVMWGEISMRGDSGESKVAGSYWEETIPAGQYKKITTSITGIQEDKKFGIVAGHVEE